MTLLVFLTLLSGCVVTVIGVIYTPLLVLGAIAALIVGMFLFLLWVLALEITSD